MKCANCGTERVTGKFCPECGSQEIVTEKKLEENKGIKCASCGRIRARGKFCPACGSQEVVTEPQVMVCSNCGTVRKAGKFCPECGNTSVEYKPASKPIEYTKPVEESQPPVTAEPVKDKKESIDDFKPMNDIRPTEEFKSLDDIIMFEDEKPAKKAKTPKPITQDDLQFLGEDVTTILSDDDDFSPMYESTETNKPTNTFNDSNKVVNNNTKMAVNNDTAQDTKPKTSSNNDTANDNTTKPVNSNYNPIHYSATPVRYNDAPQNNAPQNNTPLYQTGEPGQYFAYNYQPNPAPNTYYSDYGQQPYYAVPPRPRKPKPIIDMNTPTGNSMKKCKILIIALGILEFIAMFLPAVHYGIGNFTESVSLSDGHSFILFTGLIIITILLILAGFSNYIGAAIGLLIQSLILSLASFFVVALVNEERGLVSKGIAYYIFLIVPVVIIILSIVAIRLSIRLRTEAAANQ